MLVYRMSCLNSLSLATSFAPHKLRAIMKRHMALKVAAKSDISYRCTGLAQLKAHEGGYKAPWKKREYQRSRSIVVDILL